MGKTLPKLNPRISKDLLIQIKKAFLYQIYYSSFLTMIGLSEGYILLYAFYIAMHTCSIQNVKVFFNVKLKLIRCFFKDFFKHPKNMTKILL